MANRCILLLELQLEPVLVQYRLGLQVLREETGGMAAATCGMSLWATIAGSAMAGAIVDKAVGVLSNTLNNVISSVSDKINKTIAGTKTYQTYTKTNSTTGEVYSGRTSGTISPVENIRIRDMKHHINDKGFDPAVLDKSSTNAAAIRGREQQLIDMNGGAKSIGGGSGNAINEIILIEHII